MLGISNHLGFNKVASDCYHCLGACPRGRTTIRASKTSSEKVLGEVLEKVLRRVLRRGLAMGFAVKKGLEKGSQRGS